MYNYFISLAKICDNCDILVINPLPSFGGILFESIKINFDGKLSPDQPVAFFCQSPIFLHNVAGNLVMGEEVRSKLPTWALSEP
jgi:hypothetical protein